MYLDATGANLANPIPEPSTIALLVGLACLVATGIVRRRSR
ncbi:MAG: PEP-CTERM sorting domain-containing protein [Oceanipulchritudo sp.]